MAASDDERLISAVLASGVKIPPVPAMLAAVLALEHNDDAGSREFAALIGRDPALSGAVFRVVGSPVFGLRAKPDTLEKAITILGLRTTLAVVRSEGLRMALHDPQLAQVMASLWQRMNTVADLVLALARALRLKGVREDQAYLAGIFHDCGVALLCRRDAVYAQAFASPGVWPDLIGLDTQQATNHAVVGLLVARSWQLPAEVSLVVRHHHDPQADLPDPVRKICALIQFACHLLALRTGAVDTEWQTLWQDPTGALFAESGAAIEQLEQRFLGPLSGERLEVQ